MSGRFFLLRISLIAVIILGSYSVMVVFSEFEINDKFPNAVLISFSVGVSAFLV